MEYLVIGIIIAIVHYAILKQVLEITKTAKNARLQTRLLLTILKQMGADTTEIEKEINPKVHDTTYKALKAKIEKE
ncbi:MAG: hypothetical protein K0Q79_2648 [Flavipsychrobacter sp.]|jgi:hypothetical protein|nr:hypothetical protein [Flavipsychrobacter sp.]